MRTIVISMVVGAIVTLGVAARAGTADDCVQLSNPNLGVRGCTAVIQSGQWQGKDLAWAYVNRGVAYKNLDQPRRAIEDYDEALRLDPGSAIAYDNRGNAYANLGEHRRAIEDYDEALRLDPGSAIAYINRGNAYANLGEHRRAIEDYDEALRLDPGSAIAYGNRGSSHYSLGQYRRAVEDFNEALRLDPGDAYAYVNRGLASHEIGEFRRAIQDYDEALRLDPGDANAYASRGISYLFLRDVRRAIEDFDEALRLDPGNVTAYINRGIAHAALGEHRRAIQDVEEALRLDPSNSRAAQARALVSQELSRIEQAENEPATGSTPNLDEETVLSAQRRLAQLGFYDGTIDGIVGPKTRRAVREFQAQWDYPVTGNISQRLLGQLEAAIRIAAAVADEEQIGGTEPVAPRKTGRPKIESTGTGFHVDAEGSILTNAHVVEGCSALTVGDGVSAQLVAEAGEADLALLRAAPSAAHGVARFSTRPARLNADVTVVGFPLHGLLGGLNVTRGTVSSTSGIRGDDDYFQMTAAVQPGNSGGPVVNEYGAVIGVVVGKLDAIEIAKATGDIPQSINFAIRSELAKLFLNKHSVDFEIDMNQARVEPAALAEDAGNYTVLISCWGG